MFAFELKKKDLHHYIQQIYPGSIISDSSKSDRAREERVEVDSLGLTGKLFILGNCYAQPRLKVEAKLDSFPICYWQVETMVRPEKASDPEMAVEIGVIVKLSGMPNKNKINVFGKEMTPLMEVKGWESFLLVGFIFMILFALTTSTTYFFLMGEFLAARIAGGALVLILGGWVVGHRLAHDRNQENRAKLKYIMQQEPNKAFEDLIVEGDIHSPQAKSLVVLAAKARKKFPELRLAFCWTNDAIYIYLREVNITGSYTIFALKNKRFKTVKKAWHQTHQVTKFVMSLTKDLQKQPITKN
ncbi:MAG: hypothetical protein M9899_03075 [Bdellovibrionaceae bacterium]|nr:hypothetical protein [Pseudobdellovibrionaceae bacterium]